MKLKKKSICTLLMAGIIAMLVSGCSDTKLGYIDTERVMKESPQLQQTAKAAEDAYAQKAQEITEKLEKGKSSMSDEDYQKAVLQGRSELAVVQAPYSAQMKTLVDTAMADIAKTKDLSAIVEKDHITSNQFGQAQKAEIVIQGGIDVTDELIKKLQ